MSGWICARTTKNMLVADGWVSPDTYGREFTPITDAPAVYLFLLHETESHLSALVAYVGMSAQLSQRLSGHEIYTEISQPGYWPMRWFKPVYKGEIRAVEAEYIHRFDPPWNIQGRRRGVIL